MGDVGDLGDLIHRRTALKTPKEEILKRMRGEMTHFFHFNVIRRGSKRRKTSTPRGDSRYPAATQSMWCCESDGPMTAAPSPLPRGTCHELL